MKKRIFLLAAILAGCLILFPLILAPIVHDNHSPKSAIRNYIYKSGYPYQSFFVPIENRDRTDPTYGEVYTVYWSDWKSETKSTGTICYAKKIKDNEYQVSCGTGP